MEKLQLQRIGSISINYRLGGSHGEVVGNNAVTLHPADIQIVIYLTNCRFRMFSAPIYTRTISRFTAYGAAMKTGGRMRAINKEAASA
jgi:hypothetical protein